MKMPTLRLSKHEDRRLMAGHLWVYSNEIDQQQTPLKSFQPGELAIIQNSQGKNIGMGYVNPHSLICARILTRETKTIIDESFFIERFKKALALREQFFHEPYYRFVFGESDGLPGLVIDRYNDILVAQLTTAGMENLKLFIRDALVKLINPKAILLRNDASHRTLENLPKIIEPLHGDAPSEVLLIENETQFYAPILEGQKTGWFYDHRNNRKLLQQFAKDKTVLDIFSYIGGWGIEAATAGAKEVLCIDSSEFALGYLKRNAELNNVQDKIHAMHDDAFDALKKLRENKTTFDIVIADPPAFIKSRKHLKEGLQGYHRLNELALSLVADDGLFISASCSQHLSRDMLLNILRDSSVKQQRFMRVIAEGSQGFDHPVHPAMPETHYLKAFFTI